MNRDVELEYRKVAEPILHGVRNRLVCALDKATGASLSCDQCLCKTVLLNLIVTVRLHHSLKDNNRKFNTTQGRKNRNVLKLSNV